MRHSKHARKTAVIIIKATSTIHIKERKEINQILKLNVPARGMQKSIANDPTNNMSHLTNKNMVTGSKLQLPV